MNINEARQIGKAKLRIDDELFEKCYRKVVAMGGPAAHRGPLTLALAILGASGATDPKTLSSELTDALALVSKAESEWRMDGRVQ